VDAIVQGDWSRALEALKKIPDSDGPKQFLLEQMGKFSNTPPADWDGAFTLDSK